MIDYGHDYPDSLSDDSPLQGEVHRGQVRMAYRLARSYADRLMFVYGLGWFVWEGGRWLEDDQGAAKRAVLEVLGAALGESLGDKELRADVAKCETGSGVAGVLDIASALTEFAYTVRHLDADPYLVNVANGTLDLRTMELRPHDPRDRITKIARGAYVPDVPASVWEPFITSVLPNDEVRAFLQRLVGVALLGKVVEHILAIETGAGANGKGTSYKALLWALGDYADTVDPDLFMLRDGAHPTGEMDLRGLRLVVVSESDRDRRLAEATMKRLTGGDIIKARRMRQDFVSFNPSHTAILVTNHLPKVSGDDPAVWRRIRVVPFDVVFAEDEQDHGLDEKLRLAADEIIAWAVAGYQRYTEVGLADPDEVKAATTRYQQDSDTLGRFIADRCLVSPHTSATTSELYQEFGAWAESLGIDAISSKLFGQSLDDRGYPVTKSNGRRVRRGLGLLAEGDDGE